MLPNIRAGEVRVRIQDAVAADREGGHRLNDTGRRLSIVA